MKAVMMVCTNRSVTLRTSYGSIAFEKDVPRLVAPQMVDKALQIGVLPVDPEEKLFDTPVKENEPIDPGSRMVRIEEAIEDIYERNDPDDFTAGDKPSVKAVQRVSKIPKVSAMDIKTVLDKRNKYALGLREAQERDKQRLKDERKAEADPPDDNEYDS